MFSIFASADSCSISVRGTEKMGWLGCPWSAYSGRKIWTGSIAQWVKHKDCKHEDLSSYPLNPWKVSTVALTCNPSPPNARWEAESGEALEACAAASGGRWGTAPKEEVFWPVTHTHIHTHPHTHTQHTFTCMLSFKRLNTRAYLASLRR